MPLGIIKVIYEISLHLVIFIQSYSFLWDHKYYGRSNIHIEDGSGLRLKEYITGLFNPVDGESIIAIPLSYDIRMGLL